jgi:D-beta-D-heptose 7-phosphate kinase/D-beta-D-heptose 1-phosphate adenosyltransferase
LCRWDVEETNCGITGDAIASIQQALLRNFESGVAQHSPAVVIFSDYDKGVFTGNAVKWLEAEGIQDSITIVDPKKGPLEKWKGCDVFKPNVKEAQDLTGHKDWQSQCKYLYKYLNCRAVIITQGGDGVVGLVSDQLFEYRPTRTIYPDSVIGAGDCFVAFLAMGLAHCLDIKHVVEVAYEAGAIYVQRKHNAPVMPHELLSQADPEAAKIRMPPESRNYKLVFTNGCFDILHEGHLATLRRARAMGDKLVVAVNSDESIKKLKGEDRPIIGLAERMRMLAGLECVDFVVPFEEDTPYEIIKKIRPSVLVKGQDWEGNIVGSDIVTEVYALPLLEGLSTTGIISKIMNPAPSCAKPPEELSHEVIVDVEGIMALPGMVEQIDANPETKEALEDLPSVIDLKDVEIPSVIGLENLDPKFQMEPNENKGCIQ